MRTDDRFTVCTEARISENGDQLVIYGSNFVRLPAKILTFTRTTRPLSCWVWKVTSRPPAFKIAWVTMMRFVGHTSHVEVMRPNVEIYDYREEVEKYQVPDLIQQQSS